jgi:hypothetical protein
MSFMDDDVKQKERAVDRSFCEAMEPRGSSDGSRWRREP